MTEPKQSWIEAGYVNEPLPKDIDLKQAIKDLCKEKNATILAHYYTNSDVQDIAHFVGDSLALADQAKNLQSDIVIMCGVHFMAETVNVLAGDRLVLLPDLNATCSLAESCPPEEFAAFKAQHPDHKVISYVNTSAQIKAMSDVLVTSSNARKIVESYPKDQKLIFGPDRNLGGYLNSVTGRDMVLWQGACHVHQRFSVDKLIQLKEIYPEGKVLVHPECNGAVVKLADCVGSTAALLNYAILSDATTFLVATESGILHQMQKQCSGKAFIPVPPEEASCGCNNCNYMRLITLEKIYNCLKYEWPSIELPEDLKEQCKTPILEMYARNR